MQNESSIQTQIKQLGLLYFVVIAGQFAVFLILFLFAEDNTSKTYDGAVGDNTLPLIIALFCMTSIGMSFFMYNKRKESGRQLQVPLVEKFTHYRLSFITQAAMIEGPNLTMLIFYFFIERNYFYLLLFAIGMSAFLLIRPTADRLVEDYQLSANEQSELRTNLD